MLKLKTFFEFGKIMRDDRNILFCFDLSLRRCAFEVSVFLLVPKLNQSKWNI